MSEQIAEEKAKQAAPAVETPKESDAILEKIDKLEAELDTGAKPKPTPAEKQEVAAPPAQAKPEEKPPVQAETKPPEPGPTEDEDDLVPPDKRDNSWYARQRRKGREERDKRIAAEAKAAELEKRVSELSSRQQADQPPKQGTSVQGDPRAADVFRVYAKAKAGEFTGNSTLNLSADEQNARVAQEAMRAIEHEFDVSDIETVLDEAGRGMFGVHSDEIAQAARSALPLAIARELKRRDSDESERANASVAQERRLAELRETVSAHPEFKDESSPVFKHIDPWMKKYVGEFTQDGKLVKPGLMPMEAARFVLEHPMVQAQLVKNDYFASQYSALLAEKQRLESQLNQSRQPESGGRPAGAGGSEAAGSRGILAKIEEQFGPVE